TPARPRIQRRSGGPRGSQRDTGDTSWPWKPTASLVARTPAVRLKGQREAERGPLTHLALHPDPSPVQLHELLGECQPKPRALLLPSIISADLAELLEDGRLVLGRDPDPGVADGDGDAVLGRCGGEADPATFRRELHRVGEEVQQDLLDLPL